MVGERVGRFSSGIGGLFGGFGGLVGGLRGRLEDWNHRLEWTGSKDIGPFRNGLDQRRPRNKWTWATKMAKGQGPYALGLNHPARSAKEGSVRIQLIEGQLKG
ncbi:hypothetical protein LIER_40226 [Lithospermum erythrorhizon]|uniref:Uncharacterized protein n=1 Tax=Lithospermum erythrorhizon TaxID=34254 RepID=A0AAV3QTN8_LITER